MRSRTRIAAGAAVAVGVLGAAAVWGLLFRTSRFALALLTLGARPPEIRADVTLSGLARWFDDDFAIIPIDARTYAIALPRHDYAAVSYLILGDDRAVLFDTGPGLHDITPVVRSLTSLPVIAAASHIHYDHIGCLGCFEDVALADDPGLRALADPDGRMTPPLSKTLGGVERIAPVSFRVTAWWADGAEIELGGRSLRVIHTPGHCAGSMSLFDAASDQLFTGDVLYPGQLLAIFEGAHMGGYLATVEGLIGQVGAHTTLLPGHVEMGQDAWRLQTLAASDLRDLRDALVAIRDEGRGPDEALPPTWRVNDHVRLTATFPWNMDWTTPAHP